MTEEIIFNKEDIKDRTYVVKTFDDTSQRYVPTATYAGYDDAVLFATMMRKDKETIIASRKRIVTEVIKDEVIDVLPSTNKEDDNTENA